MEEETTEETEAAPEPDPQPEPFQYAELLACAVGANADTSGVEVDTDNGQTREQAVEAFVREHVAQRGNGDLVWLGPVFGETPPAEEVSPPEEEPPRERQTETQRAVREGNPNLPRHINQRILNPVGGRSIVEDYNPDKLPDDDYRAELWAELSKVPMSELRDSLGERTARLWDSQEFDGVREAPMSGDLLSL